MKNKNINNLKRVLMQQLMFHRIIGLISQAEYEQLIASVPSFLEACTILKPLVKAADDELVKYRELITWVATEKRRERESLALYSFPILESARAWGIKNKNTKVTENCDLSYAEMIKLGFQILLDRLRVAQSVIEPNIPVLADYKITQAVYDEWVLKTDLLAEFLNNGPKSAINKRKQIGKNVITLFKAAMLHFNTQVVPLSSNFKSHPDFYITFVNDSVIGSANTHHSRLLAHCQTELGEKLFGLTVKVDTFTDPDTGKTYKSASATTNPDGDAEVIEFFAGNRTVTVSGPNIETTTFPAIQFERGKAIAHTFIVRPKFSNIPAPQENPQNVTQ
ncbi:MAG: hypothetical protein ABIT08_15340 [Bacteroidia bacterium]